MCGGDQGRLRDLKEAMRYGVGERKDDLSRLYYLCFQCPERNDSETDMIMCVCVCVV